MNDVPFYETKECLLRAEGISLSFGENVVLRDLSAEIHNLHRVGLTQGQVVGLLGPSGMGKTRLFRILAGLDEPDTGRVLLGPELEPVKRGMVGVVAQSYPLFEHRTIHSNLKLAGRQAGLNAGEASSKANDLLKRFGIGDHGHKYPSQLSGGQRQRAAIAQQFMCSDFMLLMDEPFSGLDVNAVDAVCAFIREVAAQDEHMTLVVVTHDISAAVAVCDTIWLLGRERDAAGSIIPGAKVLHNFNLIERGLAWQKDVVKLPEFGQTVQEIRNLFPTL